MLVFAFVIGLAVLSTKWIAGARYRRGAGGNLHLIESIAVGQQTYLQLVRAGDKYIVIGVSRTGVSFVCEVAGEQVTLPEHRNIGEGVVPERFEKYLQSFIHKKTDHKDTKE
ncbi:MAG: flagellar biosynthetic protein FliO [Defluviitaleaceae bacterium]|nr:flagellar biosynthetic protein FliO [Defluviitaleaceae bacterium]